MAKRIQIPDELLHLNPTWTRQELRAAIMVVLNSKTAKIRQSQIFRIVIPHLGCMRSRGNKTYKRRKSVLKKDKKRKRELYKKQQLERDSLLF